MACCPCHSLAGLKISNAGHKDQNFITVEIVVFVVVLLALSFVVYLLIATEPMPQGALEPTEVQRQKAAERGYTYVTFKELSVGDMPLIDDVGKDSTYDELETLIPDAIKNLKGKKVAIQGFVTPLDTKGQMTISFMLTKTLPQCCFGDAIRMNEWMLIALPDKGMKLEAYQAVSVYGTLDVGQQKDKEVNLTSLFRMQADEVRYVR